MGKTPKPLTIWVHEALADNPVFQQLRDQGHIIHASSDDQYAPHQIMEDYDLVLGPNVWRMTPELLPYLDVAIKAARAGKYGKKKEE